jgi:arylformamidase
MEWIDATVPVRNGMIVYGGDPPVALSRVQNIAEGGICNLSRLEFGVHTGTHVDAPIHFIEGGAGIEAIPIAALMGLALVADARGATGNLDRPTLEGLGIPAGTERLLFRTPNSRLWDESVFSSDFIGLTEDGAEYLLERGVRLVGMDYLSIAPAGNPAPTHVALLRAGAVILEGLDLRRVEPGAYELRCLPLLLVGADGAPARVLLRPQME